jgi:long-chain acyl-CoA synthetase
MKDKNDQITGERPWFRSWPSHLPRNLEFPDVPAWWILEKNIERFADKTAVIFVDHENLAELERLTYGELWEKANALAAGLRELGINKGDRVATLLPNSPALIISYYGIWLAGATVAPCNVMSKEKELKYQLEDSGACMLISSDTLHELAGPVAQSFGLKIIWVPVCGQAGDIPDEGARFDVLISRREKGPADFSIDPSEDLAVIIYTGGTTGAPKGAMLTHRNILANTMQFAEWYDFKPGEEICICTIPMSHSGGMSGVMNIPLYAGATLVVMQRFKAYPVADLIQKYRATRFFGVPTMYVAILNDNSARDCDLSSLKACRTSAAPLPVAVKEAFDALVGREVLVEGYGLTETSPLTHANPIDRPKAGSIGIPLPGTDAKVVDCETGEDMALCEEGELVIKGPQVMKGYLNKPEATAEAMAEGWFHTGDLAVMDGDGYFIIVDRIKDMINTGGYKVWPREVEEVLYSHPKVNLAMAVGVADDYFGEIVKAFIVPRDDHKEDISSEEILAYCKEKMATYKVPRLVEFRESLPISPQGKMLRRVMRDETKTAQCKK